MQNLRSLLPHKSASHKVTQSAKKMVIRMKNVSTRSFLVVSKCYNVPLRKPPSDGILSMFHLSKTTTSNVLMTLGSASVVGFQIVRVGGFSFSSSTQFRCFNATHKATRHTTCRNIINQHNLYMTNIPRKQRNPLKF